MILSEKSRAPGGGTSWPELKSDEHLSAITSKTYIWCRFIYHLLFWIITRIYYSWDCSIFQYQTMRKSSVELGLVYKRSSTNTLEKLRCCPGKTNCIHCLRNTGFFGKLNKVIFPSQPKHTSLETFFPSESRASVQPDEACWWARTWSCSGWCMHGRVLPEKCPYKDFHRRLHQQVPQSRKLSETCTNPEVRFLPQKYSVISSNCFLKLCPCLAWESRSLTV